MCGQWRCHSPKAEGFLAINPNEFMHCGVTSHKIGSRTKFERMGRNKHLVGASPNIARRRPPPPKTDELSGMQSSVKLFWSWPKFGSCARRLNYTNKIKRTMFITVSLISNH
ncbi:Ferredoxin II [Candidatus Hodgkinia cicadicola]|nr:Ferredoxin II [Candidatus Hodgkinia cicadicola]